MVSNVRFDGFLVDGAEADDGIAAAESPGARVTNQVLEAAFDGAQAMGWRHLRPGTDEELADVRLGEPMVQDADVIGFRGGLKRSEPRCGIEAAIGPENDHRPPKFVGEADIIDGVDWFGHG